MDQSEVKEVQVRFVPKYETDNPVPDNAFAVPITLARYGLSEIVNHLSGQDPPIPYDFLINGKFLRRTIKRYLKSKSTEDVLTLEYVEALPAPNNLPSQPHPDWISAISGSYQKYIVTGCYDGLVRIFSVDDVLKESNSSSSSSSSSDSAIAVGTGHRTAIKSLTSIVSEDESQSISFITGSKDRSLRLWQFDPSNGECYTQSIYHGHVDSLESVAYNHSSKAFCSGGWDNSVLLWSTKEDGKREMGDDDDGDDDENHKAKKRKLGKGSGSAGTGIYRRSPFQALEGHKGCVGALCWPHSSSVYSGSWDHCLKRWDTETGMEAGNWQSNTVISGLAFSFLSNTLASAHCDKTIRIWDPRKSDKEALSLSLKSHKKWVSDVSWSPASAHLLASTSYDGTVKLWDIRSTIPLHTLEAHSDKALCVDWHGNNIISGGADCQLAIHQVELQASVEQTQEDPMHV